MRSSAFYRKETRSEAKNLRLNLKLEQEKSLLGLQQVNYFVDQGIIPKLKVKGILEDKFVKTLVNRESHRSIFRGLLDELLSKTHPKQQQQKSSITNMEADVLQKPNETEMFLIRVNKIYSPRQFNAP
ncbi:uncharacterized protein LOC112686401 [Sipha flava]|uniref:Uncharacterized protein LOC112686401 n=1 Tax=Sipha flava TaxID=143950 RepID=A0A8B8FVB1_9HEMI|nr:uncharacterized protein LOC112686401 [Sipha flava]